MHTNFNYAVALKCTWGRDTIRYIFSKQGTKTIWKHHYLLTQQFDKKIVTMEKKENSNYGGVRQETNLVNSQEKEKKFDFSLWNVWVVHSPEYYCNSSSKDKNRTLTLNYINRACQLSNGTFGEKKLSRIQRIWEVERTFNNFWAIASFCIQGNWSSERLTILHMVTEQE